MDVEDNVGGANLSDDGRELVAQQVGSVRLEVRSLVVGIKCDIETIGLPL